MAIFPNDLLRDLFQNNIDYVSKQIGRILDSLYGEQATENSPLEYQPLILHAVTARGEAYGRCFNDMSGSWQETPNEYYIFNVDISETAIDIKCTDALPYPYGSRISETQRNKIENIIIPAYKSMNYHIPLADYNIDHLSFRGQYIRAYNDSNTNINIGFSEAFSGSEVANRTFQLNLFRIQDSNQTFSVNQQSDYRLLYVNPSNTYVTDSPDFHIYPFKSEYYPSSVVMLPDSDAVNVDNTFNTYNTYEYDYNGDTVYNYYSDDGDIIINGGSGTGIAPVVGLGYADFKLIIDGLIDDLNLKFNFGGDGSTEPLQYAPTWDELHYVDQGSFYIEPIKQIPALPVAPDVADTVIDVSDYVTWLGGASTALFGMLDGLGLSLIAMFTFLSVLVIRHLKR